MQFVRGRLTHRNRWIHSEMTENSVKLVAFLNIKLRSVQWFQRLYQGAVPFGDSGKIQELHKKIQ